MADIEHSLTISSNIVEVYQAVTAFEDKESLAQWQPALRSVGVTAGNPLRTGSMIGMKRHFILSEIFVNADVTDMQRNKRFDLKGVHGRFPFERQIEFAPQGRETQITDRIWLKTGFIFFWWRPVVLSVIKRQTSEEWQHLKQLLEQG